MLEHLFSELEQSSVSCASPYYKSHGFEYFRTINIFYVD